MFLHYLYLITYFFLKDLKHENMTNMAPAPKNKYIRWIPLTRLRSSTGQDTALCYRAFDSRASRRCSICCGWSGSCHHAGTVRSERFGSESLGCCRFWYSAPILLRSICRENNTGSLTSPGNCH